MAAKGDPYRRGYMSSATLGMSAFYSDDVHWIDIVTGKKNGRKYIKGTISFNQEIKRIGRDRTAPFNVTLTADNEYGARAEMKLLGVYLDDAPSLIEPRKEYSFIVAAIKPWRVTNGSDIGENRQNFNKEE
jgi:hypothetical protein